MLNPSGPAQKKPREEDSSGSDAGSEVSLEPVATETDRFGFILANGSTAGCVGPPPQLVRQREAKWINIISQWDCMLLKKTSKVKEQCQKGIPASLRAKCWPLLCGASDRMKHNEDLYRSLDSRPAVQSWVDVIERDLDRQFPFHEMFLSRDGHGQRGLFRVLKAYTQYQPEEGYCQAQGPVAAVLLMNMPAEEAFWCLVQISEQYLPGYYSPLLEGVLFDAAMLTWVLKRACPAAHRHLQRHGVEPLMFATDWLMCLFTRHLPFNTLLRVWDLFFCYGVRVLFQVAVVLVRRVLGRAEQRQECQGQMETLERLRGVREQVQQEDDTFIAEVCSVPLSGRDLERRTEKELEKWRKDRPSSTFDPRGRCHGYRMAWARAREKEEEQDRTERARGNLSLPLVRSVSTLSLSPSLLQKRWRIGAKVNAGEREGGNRVQRNFSMGAREKGWDSWTDRNLKKVQPVEEEEDKVSEEVKKQSRPKPTGRVERNELLREPEGPVEKQNAPIQRLEERETPKEQAIERVEPRKAEIEANQPGETEESRGSVKVPDRQTEHSVEEDRTAETERNESPAEARCAGDAAHHRDHIQGEELDSNSQSQVLEQQIHNNQETVNRDGRDEEETVKQVTESEHMGSTEETQTETKTDGDTDTSTDAVVDISKEPTTTQADTEPEKSGIENVQQIKMERDTEIRTDSVLGLGSQTDIDVEAMTDTAKETNMQQEQDAMMQTDKSLQADIVEDLSIEPLTGTETKVVTETETTAAETQEKVKEDTLTQEPQAETQMKAEKDVDLHQGAPSLRERKTEEALFVECIHQKGETDLVVRTTESTAKETDVEIPVSDSTAQSHEAFTECSEEKCETVVELEATQTEERVLAAPTQAEDTETTDPVTPPEKSQASTQPAKQDSAAEPDGKTISLQTVSSDHPAPKQPESQVTVGPEEEKNRVEGADDAFLSSPNQSGSSNISQSVNKEECCTVDSPCVVSDPQLENKGDSHLAEKSSPDPMQACGYRIRASSDDFRVRKSSSSRGSRLARRLSEDLFTAPRSQTQSNPGSTNSDQTNLDTAQSGAPQPDQEPAPSSSREETGSTQGTGAKPEQRPPDAPKRFGLFRRLRGEQPKQTMQVPKILIQDFSDGVGKASPIEEESEEKLSSRERRRRRRERERKEKEEEKVRKKREKELEKERRKSSRVQREKGSADVSHPAGGGSQTRRYSAAYAETYF